ncbi:MAG: hypothetical protein CBB87_08045 [Micavibrio sp. TMED27]|nr:hypothetical protein [Micavibrio sp.]OUT90622.1 MAG: hypothetical protein CBB87_08045 [Micavibrio sp. TMED27]|tara:strand:+ start:187 stop:804 length:618 start_codon:yes stop_codon:yes gene_type:complete
MIGAIENDIIARVKAISESGALGYSFRQVKTYSGELRHKASRAKLKNFPSFLLAFDRLETQRSLNNQTICRARFAIFIAVQNERNEKATRHGDGKEVGAYQIAIDMLAMFTRYLPDVEGCSAIENMSIQPISIDEESNRKLAVFMLPFQIEFPVKLISPDVDLTNPLEAIHTNWDTPPIGEVGLDGLPDDENAQLTSHVTGDAND